MRRGLVWLLGMTPTLALGSSHAPMRWSPDGRWVLFGCDKSVVRWDPDGKVDPIPVQSADAVEGAVALPDGRLVLAMLDGTIRGRLTPKSLLEELKGWLTHGRDGAA